jgi:eukaryotic-like serine/threonine-protein kinase
MRRDEVLTPERWKQAELLFDQALSRTPDERAAYLQASTNNESLVYLVLQLLKQHDSDPDFLNAPVVDTNDFIEILVEKAPDPVLADGRVGPYRVIDRLGEGGMGTVYLAERADGHYIKRVCIKMLRDSTKGDFLVGRFLDERQILAELDHPNIARLLDGGTTENGLPYLVMEYVKGEPLDRYCAQRRFGIRQRLKLFLQICEAASYAHKRRVVHRDLKPGNILVTSEGTVKLLDFGIARLIEPQAQKTAPGYRMFTPNYAAPEQVEGKDISPACDVYSLGVVLYELLSGKRPPPATAKHSATIEPPSRTLERVWIAAAGLSEKVERLRYQLQGELDAVVLKALAHESSHRYATVADLAADLKRYLAAEAVEAFSNAWWYRWSKFAKRNKERFGLVLATAILVIAFAWSQFNATFRPAPGQTVAVLPFENSGGNPEDSYLSNGITVGLTTQLGKISELTVIANRSTRQFKDSSRSLKDIAHELGATSIVTGNVRQEGQLLRVSIELIDPKSGVQLWAESYDRPLSNMLSIQADITRQIARTLQARLTSDEERRTQAMQATNPMAYAYLFKGREYFDRLNTRDNDQAIGLFKRALVADPNYALGHAYLSRAYYRKYFLFGASAQGEDETLPEARRAAELDPELPEAYDALARAYYGKRDIVQAVKQSEKALSLNPNDIEALSAIASSLIYRGRLDEAIAKYKKILAIDPSSAETYGELGVAYMTLGAYQQAEHWLSKGLELDPDEPTLRWRLTGYYLRRKAYNQLRANAKRMLQVDPQSSLAYMVLGEADRYQGRLSQAQISVTKSKLSRGRLNLLVLADLALRLGRSQEATTLLARSERICRKRLTVIEDNNTLLNLAILEALRGNAKEANRWLQKAINAGFTDYWILMNDPLFERVRSNIGFMRLTIGLKERVDVMRLRVEALEKNE